MTTMDDFDRAIDLPKLLAETEIGFAELVSRGLQALAPDARELLGALRRAVAAEEALAKCAAGEWVKIDGAQKNREHFLLRSATGSLFVGQWFEKLNAWIDTNGAFRDPIHLARIKRVEL